jgi:hypothetical protein
MKHFFFLLCILLSASAFGSPEVQSGPAVGAIAPDFKVRNVVTGEDVSLKQPTRQGGDAYLLGLMVYSLLASNANSNL